MILSQNKLVFDKIKTVEASLRLLLSGINFSLRGTLSHTLLPFEPKGSEKRYFAACAAVFFFALFSLAVHNAVKSFYLRLLIGKSLFLKAEDSRGYLFVVVRNYPLEFGKILLKII